MEISQEEVQTQYEDDQNLNARIALHARFSTNAYGWFRWVFDHLTVLPGQANILELGCGPADLWSSSRERIPSGWTLTLTDFSPGMIEAARQKLGDLGGAITLKVVDAQSIPFDDGSFDAVIANHMLYHVPDRHRALREIRRVLRPDGYFYTTTVGEQHMADLWDLIAPFVPDIHDRMQDVVNVFTLENGEEQLAEVFGSVMRHDYEDALEVTEVRPVEAYLKSSTIRMADCVLDPDQWASVRRTVAAHIDVKGAFHIHKASGLFVARR